MEAGVLTWFDQQSATSLFLSVVTLGEVRQGIEQLRPHDGTQARHLDRWLTGLEQFYEDRMLYIDGTVAEEWGRLQARRTVSALDALMAATARVHRLTLVTRNVSDFDGLDVPVLNPFDR